MCCRDRHGGESLDHGKLGKMIAAQPGADRRPRPGCHSMKTMGTTSLARRAPTWSGRERERVRSELQRSFASRWGDLRRQGRLTKSVVMFV